MDLAALRLLPIFRFLSHFHFHGLKKESIFVECFLFGNKVKGNRVRLFVQIHIFLTVIKK